MQTIKRYSGLMGPIVTAVGIIVTCLGIYAGYDAYNRARPNRRLLIQVNAAIPLVDIKPEAVGDITILYKGQSVENIILIQAQISNPGNQPIEPGDYIKPITFLFPSYAKIADVSVIASDPPNIGMVITKTSDYQAEVIPVLLNPEDVVTIRFAVVANDSNATVQDLHADGRIVGIRSIELVLPSKERGLDPFLLFLIGISVSIPFSIVANLLAPYVLARIGKLTKRN